MTDVVDGGHADDEFDADEVDGLIVYDRYDVDEDADVCGCG